jgi:hypothetical protein
MTNGHRPIAAHQDKRPPTDRTLQISSGTSDHLAPDPTTSTANLIAPRSRQGLTGGDTPSSIFGFLMLHLSVGAGDFHTDDALTVAIDSPDVVTVSIGICVPTSVPIWCVMLNTIRVTENEKRKRKNVRGSVGKFSVGCTRLTLWSTKKLIICVLEEKIDAFEFGMKLEI